MGTRHIRGRVLPTGWYPSDRESVLRTLNTWKDESYDIPSSAGESAIVPHAGWAYSGRLAFKTLRMLNNDCDVVAVIGGHMMAGSGVVAAFEDEIETPLGSLVVAKDLLESLKRQIQVEPDKRPDNTVEIQLPMIKYLFPEATTIWLRVGAGEESMDLGRSLAGAAAESGVKICVAGSTDLTHYGPDYGFTPAGYGGDSYEWARKVNDAGIIQKMVEMNPRAVLEWGNVKKAACSAGAAAAAIEYAEAMGCEEGVLTGYENSCDLNPGNSFVGYAGILYSKRES